MSYVAMNVGGERKGHWWDNLQKSSINLRNNANWVLQMTQYRRKYMEWYLLRNSVNDSVLRTKNIYDIANHNSINILYVDNWIKLRFPPSGIGGYSRKASFALNLTSSFLWTHAVFCHVIRVIKNDGCTRGLNIEFYFLCCTYCIHRFCFENVIFVLFICIVII